MGIAAELHANAGLRAVGEVRGHEVRRAAVEREGRGHHAPVADRHELLNPALRLLVQQRNRVRALRRRLPVAVARAWHFGTRGLPPRRTFIDRGRSTRCGHHVSSISNSLPSSSISNSTLRCTWSGTRATKRSRSRSITIPFPDASSSAIECSRDAASSRDNTVFSFSSTRSTRAPIFDSGDPLAGAPEPHHPLRMMYGRYEASRSSITLIQYRGRPSGARSTVALSATGTTSPVLVTYRFSTR